MSRRPEKGIGVSRRATGREGFFHTFYPAKTRVVAGKSSVLAPGMYSPLTQQAGSKGVVGQFENDKEKMLYLALGIKRQPLIFFDA